MEAGGEGTGRGEAQRDVAHVDRTWWPAKVPPWGSVCPLTSGCPAARPRVTLMLPPGFAPGLQAAARGVGASSVAR